MAQEQGGRRDPYRAIGERLKRARLAAGLTARQVTERTRITAEVLHRVEAGEFDQCGGDVYARGHIRAYAQAVGLDPAPLLAEYGAIRLPPLTKRDLRKPRVAAQPAKEAVGQPPRGAQREAAKRARTVLPTIVPGAVPSLVPMAGAVPPPEVPPLRRQRRDDFTDADAGSAAALIAGTPPAVNERPAAFLAGARTSGRSGPNWSLALIGALAAVVLVAAVQLWPDSSGGSAHAADRVAARASATAHPVAAASKPAGPAPVPAPKPTEVKLTVAARTAPSWIGVTNSRGEQLYWNILRPGQSQVFTDKSKLDVIVGDVAAVDLVVNGHDLGRQGSSGQVFRASYSPSSAK